MPGAPGVPTDGPLFDAVFSNMISGGLVVDQGFQRARAGVPQYAHIKTLSAFIEAYQGWNRYPIPGSVSRCAGRDGSRSSFRLSFVKWKRSSGVSFSYPCPHTSVSS
jgi:hypothetical protein